MSDSSAESFWIPDYDTGLRLGDVPRKSSGISHVFRQASVMRSQLPTVTVSRPSRKRISPKRAYITAASAGLAFDDDVIRERCFPVDSHFKTYLHHARRQSSRRNRNDTSYLNKPVDHFRYLKPAKPVQPSCKKSEHVAELGTVNGSDRADAPRHSSNKFRFQHRKCSSDVDDVALGEKENDAAWDECLVMKLSANTARWLAQNPANTEETRVRLHKTLDAAYGPAVDDRVELVAENVGETDDVDVDAKTIKKSWLSGKDM